MGTPRLSLSLVLIATFCHGTASFAKGTDAAAAKRTLFDKNYKVLAADNDSELGTYAVKAVVDETANTMEITESIAMDYRGKKAEATTTVTYDNGPQFSAKRGTAETKIDGKRSMTGTVTFSGKTVDIECKGFLNKRTLEPIVPPKEFSKKGWPVPEGAVIFQSALPALGPRLQKEEGELKNVVFAEFPDDLGAPELINLKAGYRLVRGKANEQGEYDMEILSPNAPQSVSHVRFDKTGQIVSMRIGDIKMVEVAKDAVNGNR